MSFMREGILLILCASKICHVLYDSGNSGILSIGLIGLDYKKLGVHFKMPHYKLFDE